MMLRDGMLEQAAGPTRPPAVPGAARDATMRTVRKAWLFALGLPKTLLFNFRYFPLTRAIRLPVLVSHRVWLMELGGTVALADFRTGAVKIGYGEVGIFDQHRSRAIWQVSGRVEFRGAADIGHGSKISVTGSLIFGDRVIIAAESAIIAQHSVRIGDGTLISWDVLILDTDAHRIFDAAGKQINAGAPITIGNAVWIGSRSLILKGVRVADGVVVAAASNVTRSIDTPHVVVGGNPARVIRENIRWKR